MPAPESPSDYAAVINMLQEIHSNQLRFAESMVHRDQCDSVMCDLFNRVEKTEHICSDYLSMKEVFVKDSALARAESLVLERAREEDGKAFESVLKKIDKLDRAVCNINEKMAILSFSKCTLMWIWNNKKSVAAVFALLSSWLFAIVTLSRLIS